MYLLQARNIKNLFLHTLNLNASNLLHKHCVVCHKLFNTLRCKYQHWELIFYHPIVTFWSQTSVCSLYLKKKNQQQRICPAGPTLLEGTVLLTTFNLSPVGFWDFLGDQGCPKSDPTSELIAPPLWPAVCWHAWPHDYNTPGKKPYCRDHTCKKHSVHYVCIR